jgi:signal transduction histidine kinase
MHNWYFKIMQKHEWRIAAILLGLYVIVSVLSALFVPASAELYPGYAVALCFLYFGGLRLWPFLYAAALVVSFSLHTPALFLLVIPIATTLQAFVGAFLLKHAHIDPLFRRYRNMLDMIGTVIVVSCISPTFEALVFLLQGRAFAYEEWGRDYIATLFSLLILTPFLLRWFAKPKFSRTWLEKGQILGVFGVLIALSIVLFDMGVGTVYGLPLTYLILIPLFYITLRFRPRFVTLGFVVMAVLAVYGTVAFSTPDVLTYELLSRELFLITLAIAFYIVVSLEEERRVSTNIMLSQLATMANVVARVSSESNAKNHFIAILAHELRNPLAPVVSAIDILRLTESNDKKQRETLDMMSNQMDTVRHLLDDLLDISRISESKMSLTTTLVNIQSVIKHALLSTEHHRHELHQSLALELPKENLYVLGDQVRLEQVFSNLLTNASKYSFSGSTVKVVLKRKEEVLEVDIVDEGVGITPDALEAIFMPFHQIEDGERSKKGLGIGLALVRSITEMHGGNVKAASKGRGQGSVFTISLPLAPKESIPEDADLKVEKKVFSPKGEGAPLVLVVDDNDAAAAGIGKLLELNGYQVEYAYDAKTGNQESTLKLASYCYLRRWLARPRRLHGGKIFAQPGFCGASCGAYWL